MEEWISHLKGITAGNVVSFFIEAGLVLIGNWCLKGLARLLALKKPELKNRFLPAAGSLLNWITFYGIILLFLVHFSTTKWLFEPLYSKDGIKVSAFLIIVAFMIVTLASRIIKLFTKYVLSNIYEHYNVDKGLSYTINQIIYYTVMISALAFSFTIVGINLTALGAILGVLGIGIGFGMRNIAGNFVSGIIILFERPIEVGEVIEVNGKIGRVEKIRLRSTLVRTAKEGTLIIPNQYFIETIIKNRTGAEMRAEVKVSVSQGVDSKLVHRLLEDAVDQIKENCEGILMTSQLEIRFVNFRNSAMDFSIELPVVNFEIKEKVESELRHSISRLFDDHKINMPPITTYPEK
ncbi:mechanosensitive ion channel domain-containing protein [Neobacillus sp. YIM B06451]|uniref:mechanosensitive ion channel family protein n=1 Tax=Neobacillus sp. YIM B06451 TaxID=3070994 RepID=UPI002931638A|nr:mechanosensitive ion channel domain-containing protein [Neobacillus sp. YIM B06451]